MNKLKELRLDRNQITSLDKHLVSCASLRMLDLSYNKLTSLEGLSGLQCLEELRVTNNNLKSLRYLKGLPALIDLDVSYNQCKTLDGLEFVPTLQVLRAGHNHVGTLKIPMTYSQQQSSAKNQSITDENSHANSTGQLNASKQRMGGGSNRKVQSTSALSSQSRTGGAHANSNESTKKSTPVVGLQYLSEVYLTGNRLKSFDGLGTLGSNIEVLDFSGNKLSASALLPPTNAPIEGLAVADISSSGLQALCAMSKLKEIRLTMNPISDDPRSMQAIVSELRGSCKHLEAVDGTSFLSGGGNSKQGWKLTGIDDDADSVFDADGDRSVTSEVTKNTRQSALGDTSVVGADSDLDEEDDDEDDDEEGKPLEDDEGMTLNAKGERVKREPKLRPRIYKKGIKTMEQIEAAESAIRSVFASSKQILQAIYLLDDTVDGLFASVDPKDLPAGNDQFSKILFSSQAHPIPETKTVVPTEQGAGILSPHTGMKKAIADLRAANRRAALAVGEEWIEEEPDQGEYSPLGTKTRLPNGTIVDTDESVHMQHNVTVYTTQTNVGVDMGSPDAVKGKNKGHRSMMDMLEGDSDDEKDIKHTSSVDHLPGFRPLEMDRPAPTNKQKVHQLVQSIKAQVEAELSSLTPAERKNQKTAGGTVGVTTRPSHDMDLPVGSGLTRYGSKIKSKDSTASVSTVSATASQADVASEGSTSPLRSHLNHFPSVPSPITSTMPTLADDVKGYDMNRPQDELASKQENDHKAIWLASNGKLPSPIQIRAMEKAEAKDGPGKGIDEELDRKTLQEAIDRRLGFSLTDPKSPVPSRGGQPHATRPFSAPDSNYDNENDNTMVSPRIGAFDKFQITAVRPTSANSKHLSEAAVSSMQQTFSQTFDPRFMHKPTPREEETGEENEFDRADDEYDEGNGEYDPYRNMDGEEAEHDDDEEGEGDDFFTDEAGTVPNINSKTGHTTLYQPFGNLPLSPQMVAMNDDDDDDDDDSQNYSPSKPKVTITKVDHTSVNAVSSSKMADLLNARRALSLGSGGGPVPALPSQALPAASSAALAAAISAAQAATGAGAGKSSSSNNSHSGERVLNRHSVSATPMTRPLMPMSSIAAPMSVSSGAAPKFRPRVTKPTDDSDSKEANSLESMVLSASMGHLSPRP